MTLKQYKAFVYTMECGSITKAAEMLSTTQSGLTHLLIDLEEELGFVLMKRNKGGVTLTDFGKKLYQPVKRVVEADEYVLKTVSTIKDEEKQNINIATFSSVAVNWLPAIINGFRELHKDVEISIFDGGYGDIQNALDEGISDLGFIAMEVGDRYQVYPLIKDRILAVVPNSDKYSKFDRLPVNMFATEEVVSLGEETDMDSRMVFEKAGIKPNIKYRTKDDYAMISMVENNLGICLEPELLLNQNKANVKVMELDPPEYRTIALAVPYEKQSRPIVREFADYIVKWIHKYYNSNNK